MVRVDPGDQQARDAKADALRRIGYTTPNSNWRSNLDGAQRFFRYFDPPSSDPINLAER